MIKYIRIVRTNSRGQEKNADYSDVKEALAAIAAMLEEGEGYGKPHAPKKPAVLVTPFAEVKPVTAFGTTFYVPAAMQYVAVDDDGEVYAYAGEVVYDASLNGYNHKRTPDEDEVASPTVVFLGYASPTRGVKHMDERVVKV